ncbi:P-loop containing nucleoside triphosphate hydrolase protein [Gymnopilus junonius]|uniref:P-loop containing nucleoside triphosphate hydrolase protein n=1 Tax=Gymnopilus junonius TaxID=109634 RepID=A0A9P5NNW1_GYMJU|nr:P-loop containing nucleoside triphosphate hydrolase protein [Gymnopilus junonius]
MRPLKIKPISLGINHTRSSVRTLRTQPRDMIPESHENDVPRYPPGFGLATPRQLVDYLNQFVIGQENAKKVLSVAVFNHYNRVRANLEYQEPENILYGSEESGTDQEPLVSSARLRPLRKKFPPLSLRTQETPPLFEKSNVLILGPTGSGKTLLARTLAKVLDVPFSAGYVGEDVDMAIQRLVQAANYDPLRASTGIVYIDEVDKIARRSASGTEGSRDVGGEGVQQALLRMMEGSVVTVQAKGGTSVEIPPGTGASNPRAGQRVPHLTTPKSDVYHIDTTNVLFILSGAFVGLDKVIKKRVAKGSIGFTANLASESNPLPFFTSNRKAVHNPLDLVETSDLVQYGFIPEFISRLPSITALAPLTIPDLRRILTEVKGSLISQYMSLFAYSGVEIRFTSAALDEICKKAFERGGGARGLRGIMESLLLDPMYEVPGSVSAPSEFHAYSVLNPGWKDICHVLITADTVRGVLPAGYWKKGQSVQFWETWATEEGNYAKGKS